MSEHAFETRGSRVWKTTWRAAVASAIGLAAYLGVYAPLTDQVQPTAGTAAVAVLMIRLIVDIPIGIAAIVLYSLRRSAPFVICMIVIALSSLSMFAAGAGLLALTSIAAGRRTKQIVIAAATMLTIGLTEAWFGFQSRIPPGWPRRGEQLQEALLTSATAIVLTGLLVLVGALIGTNRGRRVAVLESALSAQRAAEADLHRAKSDERTRIAREMHDALAHRLSLVAMHAGALEYRTDLAPEQVRSTAKIVSDNSRLALEELRDILGVLRSSDLIDARLAQPTALDLPELVAESSRGVSIASTLPPTATLAAVPSTLGLHAYRLVQEVLTNHRKHAPTTALTLVVTATAGDAITVRSDNAVALVRTGTVSSGHGLDGLAERVRLAGGTLRSGITDDRFRVEARLPWQN